MSLVDRLHVCIKRPASLSASKQFQPSVMRYNMSRRLVASTCLVLACVFALFPAASAEESFQVYFAHADLKQDYPSGLQLRDPPVRTFRSVSLCLRFLSYSLKPTYLLTSRPLMTEPGQNTPWYFAVLFNLNLHTADTEDVNWLNFHHWYMLRYLLNPLQWNHFCFSFDYVKKRLVTVVNGQPVVDETDKELPESQPSDTFFEDLWIGKNAVTFGSAQSLVGELTDFNAWDEALSEKAMTEWTSCRLTGGGKLVEWKTAEFDNTNMSTKQVPMSSICQPIRPGLTTLPEKRSFLESERMCRIFGGRMTYPEDEAHSWDIIDTFSDYADVCGYRFWAALWDDEDEGNFTHFYTKQGVKYNSFILNHPDGKNVENCVSLEQGNSMNDLACNKKLCTVCYLHRRPSFTLRGACLASSFDKRFSWTGALSHKRYRFHGWSNSILTFDSEENRWLLSPVSELGSTFAYYNETTEYPVGKRNWTFIGEPCYGFQATNQILQFSSCSIDEYSCDSGLCIPIVNRCNRRDDCGDNSDEDNCHVAIWDSNYFQEYPPLGPVGTINLLQDVRLYAVTNVDETSGTFRAQFDLSLTWYDSRLRFHNLKELRDMNTLSFIEQKSIWVPKLIFDNTAKKEPTVNDRATYVTVNRMGKFKRSFLDVVDNIFIYKGQENPLTMSRIYNIEFMCEFHLEFYPFDKQECSMTFRMDGNLGSFVNLTPGQLKYLGPVDITLYYIQDISMHSTQRADGSQGIVINISLGRRLLGVILTTYLPTFFIMVIVYLVRFFKALHFEAIATVTMTCMLTMTTLFIGTSNSLPDTSYTKLIDVWMIFGLAFTFFEFVMQTVMQFHTTTDSDKNTVVVADTKRVNVKPQQPKNKALLQFPVEVKRPLAEKRARIRSFLDKAGHRVVPLVLGTFVVGYFLFGVIVLQTDQGLSGRSEDLH